MIVKGIVINAELNESVSHGTLRYYDLFKSLTKVIENTPEYKEMMADKGGLLHKAWAKAGDEWDPWWETEESYILMDDIWEICDSYAPKGYCFSANEGDGSDFGYWKFDTETL